MAPGAICRLWLLLLVVYLQLKRSGSELTPSDYAEIGRETARRKPQGIAGEGPWTWEAVDVDMGDVGGAGEEGGREQKRRLFMDTHMRDTNRTAILLSGQLRSSNLTWAGGQIRRNRESVMFGSSDPPTPAACIATFLFESLHKQGGGFDVFMYLTAKHDAKASDWNGNPLLFEPAPGDTTACRCVYVCVFVCVFVCVGVCRCVCACVCPWSI